ncbi:MAG: DUF3429 domain-containing protein [Pseudomonadota bacterium]|nr:DUF3429 domain-containing protein [Pseudomonadota bacterium]
MVAGVLPFVIFSAVLPLHLFHDAQAATGLLLTYAVIIVSFLGGIHWGIAVLHHHEHRRISNLLITESVWAPLTAWGILLYGNIYAQLLVLTLLYSFIWSVDSLMYNNNLIPQWFFNLSCVITPIVVVSLYVAYFGLI